MNNFKFIFLYVFLSGITILLFPGCSDDNEKVPKLDDPENIVSEFIKTNSELYNKYYTKILPKDLKNQKAYINAVLPHITEGEFKEEVKKKLKVINDKSDLLEKYKKDLKFSTERELDKTEYEDVARIIMQLVNYEGQKARKQLESEVNRLLKESNGNWEQDSKDFPKKLEQFTYNNVSELLNRLGFSLSPKTDDYIEVIKGLENIFKDPYIFDKDKMKIDIDSLKLFHPDPRGFLKRIRKYNIIVKMNYISPEEKTLYDYKKNLDFELIMFDGKWRVNPVTLFEFDFMDLVVKMGEYGINQYLFDNDPEINFSNLNSAVNTASVFYLTNYNRIFQQVPRIKEMYSTLSKMMKFRNISNKSGEYKDLVFSILNNEQYRKTLNSVTSQIISRDTQEDGMIIVELENQFYTINSIIQDDSKIMPLKTKYKMKLKQTDEGYKLAGFIME